MRLPKWSEPFAVGLLVVLIDIPYDIVSVRFVHWTWHDTDPNIFDRHYWVPWNSYYFHATFAASFTFWFHFLKDKLCKNIHGKWIADKRSSREVLCTILAGLLGAPGGILMFIAIYHPLHDIYEIHGEVTFFTIFAIFLVLIWTGDRLSRKEQIKETSHETHWTTWVLLAHLVLHYLTFLGITIFFNPENEISTGIKEKLGPCDEYVSVQSPIGMVLSKRKYLCPTDYDEQYFDWSCLPAKKHPSLGSLWYTTCGIPFINRPEYILIISLICGIAAAIFYNLHFCSKGDSVFYKSTKQEITVSKKKVK